MKTTIDKMLKPTNSDSVFVCKRCGLAKPRDDFYKDASCARGIMYHCKECSKKKSVENNRIRSQSLLKNNSFHHTTSDSYLLDYPDDINKMEDLDLSFVYLIRKKSRKEWAYPETLRFLKGVKKATQNLVQNLDPVFKKLVPNRSKLACSDKLKEIRKAHEKGMTLKEYFKAGCPFRAGQQVVFKAKEKSKSILKGIKNAKG